MAIRLVDTSNLYRLHPRRDEFVPLVNSLLKALYLKRAVNFHNNFFVARYINNTRPLDAYLDPQGQHIGPFHAAVIGSALGPLDLQNQVMRDFVSFCNSVLEEAGYKKQINLQNGQFTAYPLPGVVVITPPFQDNIPQFQLFRAFEEVIYHANPTLANPITVAETQTRVLARLQWYGVNVNHLQNFLVINNNEALDRYVQLLNDCAVPGLAHLHAQRFLVHIAGGLHFQ